MFSLQTEAAINGVPPALVTPEKALIVLKSFFFFKLVFFVCAEKQFFTLRQVTEKPDSFSSKPLF